MTTTTTAGWVPHKSETWTARFGTLVRPVQFERWTGHRTENGAPVYDTYELPAGTRVKIVMVSRFGDLGVNDNLLAERGYVARVAPAALTDLSMEARR